MTKLLFILLLTLFTLPSFASGANYADIKQKYLLSPQKIGEGRMSFLFWDIYDASLHVSGEASGNVWQADAPYALSLDYLYEITGKDIAEASIDEIKKQGFEDEAKLAKWQEQMEAIFPDVGKGTNITGIRNDAGDVVFYHNGENIGSIKDAEFTRLFFGIWLSEKTSEPKLRKKLLGL